MNKKLPGIYRSTINKKISNNMNYSFVGLSNIDENDNSNNTNFSDQYVFNTLVEIETKEGVFNTKIVSKIKDHILTSDNRIIKLNDIKNIKIKGQ